jgi:hypothetical protein
MTVALSACSSGGGRPAAPPSCAPLIDHSMTSKAQGLALAYSARNRVNRVLAKPVVVLSRRFPNARAMAEDADDTLSLADPDIDNPLHGALTLPSNCVRAGRGVKFRVTTNRVSPWTTCVIRLVGSDAPAKALLAHEVYHCFQYEKVGYPIPSVLFVKEGAAQYAAAVLAGADGSIPESWRLYFETPGTGQGRGQPLMLRSYDALGFYAHLANHLRSRSENIFAVMDRMVVRTLPGPHPELQALDAAVASGDATFLTSWAAGMWRKHGYPLWTTSGPGLSNTGASPRRVPFADIVDRFSVEESINRYEQLLADLTLRPPAGRAGAVLQLSVRGHSAYQFARGGRPVLQPVQTPRELNQRWCTHPSRCDCLSGRESMLEALPARNLWLAVSGRADGGSIDVRFVPHDTRRDCEEVTDVKGEGAPEAAHCIVGTWRLAKFEPWQRAGTYGRVHAQWEASGGTGTTLRFERSQDRSTRGSYTTSYAESVPVTVRHTIESPDGVIEITYSGRARGRASGRWALSPEPRWLHVIRERFAGSSTAVLTKVDESGSYRNVFRQEYGTVSNIEAPLSTGANLSVHSCNRIRMVTRLFPVGLPAPVITLHLAGFRLTWSRIR